MRTGSVGNRSAEDMVNTLVEPKKRVISQIRKRLLELGYTEDVEYDSINIEPVLIYRKSEHSVFLKHKWELVGMIPINKSEDSLDLANFDPEISALEITDEEGNHWVKLQLPGMNDKLISLIEKMK
jgi:hypothetical protein